MFKVIRGKRYDTESARLIGSCEEGSLYRKQTGEFFLFISGEIIPVHYDRAKQWSADHLHSQREFTPHSEDLVLTSVRLPATLHARLKREALRRGISLRALIIEILTLYKTGDPR